MQYIKSAEQCPVHMTSDILSLFGNASSPITKLSIWRSLPILNCECAYYTMTSPALLVSNKTRRQPCLSSTYITNHVLIDIIQPNLQYKSHFSRQLNCWSFRCSWSIACRRCSNYIFVLDLTPGFNGLSKGNCNTRREIFTFWDFVQLISDSWRYIRYARLHSIVYCICLNDWYSDKVRSPFPRMVWQAIFLLSKFYSITVPWAYLTQQLFGWNGLIPLEIECDGFKWLD